MIASTEQIKKLRELTGAGVLDAKRTLEQYNGDFDKALAVLKEKGLKAAEKKAERVARQGIIEAYIHAGGKIGVLVEVNCETDFVAATNEFKQLAHDLALQIAASKPRYVSVNDIPAAELEAQKKIYADAARAEGKPEELVERIAQGKIDAALNEIVLLRQPFIRDESLTVHDLIQSVIAKVGENIVVRRFARFELGE
ncbi:MAG: elongation factor Ts [Anaerolineae bacterium]|nr:elongation factor Ts [Anaerolineae bacterium]